MTSAKDPSSTSSALALVEDGVECNRRTGDARTCLARPLPSGVLETYPVLAIIALGWTLADKERPAERLPKYNPDRGKTFAISDWAHVCRTTSKRLAAEGAPESAAWAEAAAAKTRPTKRDQDQLDACICLLSALHLAKGRDALFVGCSATGYIVVPDSEMLRNELERRCVELGRESASWVRVFRLPAAAAAAARDT